MQRFFVKNAADPCHEADPRPPAPECKGLPRDFPTYSGHFEASWSLAGLAKEREKQRPRLRSKAVQNSTQNSGHEPCTNSINSNPKP